MINNVSLTGRLTRDIMVRPAGQGQLGTFTVAVDQNFKNRNGQTGTDFIRCHVWNKRAQVMAQYLHKGSLIGITGAIRSGQFTNQQGQKVFTTYVEVGDFTFLDSKNNNGAPAGNPNPNNNRFHPNPNQQPNGPAPQQPNNAGNNGPQNSNNPTPPQNNSNNQPANSGNTNNGGNNNAPQGNANGVNNNPSSNNNGSGSNNNGSGFSNGHLPF